MKLTTIIAAAVIGGIMLPSAAFATTPDCKKSGGGYVCQIGGNTYTAYNATSKACLLYTSDAADEAYDV